jgi:hypothetical protein
VSRHTQGPSSLQRVSIVQAKKPAGFVREERVMEKRQEIWYQVLVEVIRKNGQLGDVAKAIKEADKALAAFDMIADK